MGAVPMAATPPPGSVSVWPGQALADLAQFAGDVLPATGIYALAYAKAAPALHLWFDSITDMLAEFAERYGEPDLYYAAATYLTRGTAYAGRAQANVARLRAHRIDVDVGPDKAFKTTRDAMQALVALLQGGVPEPTYIVLSGGGGFHLYWCLSDDTTPLAWKPIAKMLHAVATGLGLHPDPAVTSDEARVLRLPGSLNGKTGKRATILKNTGRKYAPAEFAATIAALAPTGPPTVSATPARRVAALRPMNAKILCSDFSDRPPASFAKIVAGCAAVALAAKDNGAKTGEPLWRALIGIVKHCDEPSKTAHSVSSGHRGYTRVGTEAKLDGYAAGPTTCEHFGVLAPEACAGCEHRSKIKSPIVVGSTIGAVGAVGAVGNAPAAAGEPFSDADDGPFTSADDAHNGVPIPSWVDTANKRYAVVRWGAGAVILDKLTPCVTPAGIRYADGFLDIAAFRQLKRGEVELVNGKLTPTADAWLSHPQRKQYAAAVFSPGETLPADVLNLWPGFAMEPMQGDVAPWLELCEHLIPDRPTRRYVLQWLALKVQKPGNVQRTILIFTGSKGTGKNSLFEPLVQMFGSAGRVFDDAEQVAGRFTGHMMTVAFAVLDEALFAGDPRQADRVKARVTATSTTYEAKGRDPVTGVNRCAYVSLSNHTHVWQATIDERRAVVIETGNGLIGDRVFWARYYAWLDGAGPSALLHHLRGIDLAGFDVGLIPRTEALRRQVEHTALRNPTAAWWYAVLDEGAINLRDGGARRRYDLAQDAATVIDKDVLRLAFDEATRTPREWPNAMKQLRTWAGGLRETRPRADGGGRGRAVEFPSLAEMRGAFSTATGIQFEPEGQA